MHPKEFKRQRTGTGRLTRLNLRNSEILVGADFSEDPRLNRILQDESLFPVILFPGPDSVDLSKDNALVLPEGKTLLVIVIDATWRLARKIMFVSRSLQGLRRICFTPSVKSRFRIKRQPMEHCVSTIEAVHYLLEALERLDLEKLEGKHSSLLSSIESLVAFQESYIKVSTEPTRHRKYKEKHGGKA
jgi:DTW domain-containing protein YfiP